MGKGGGQTVGFRYYMSLHMGLCRGPIDELVQINVGDVRAWPVPDGDSEKISGLATTAQGPNGNGISQFEDGTYASVDASEINTISTSGGYEIDAPNLFGGDKKEGGIVGALRVMMGEASQVVPAFIKTLMGGRVPDFRGVVTLYYNGLLTSLNPYPKKWDFRVRRTESGWDGEVWQPSLVTIWMRGGTIKAMNPAHILYECLTNRDWARGMPRAALSEPEWLLSAQTLFNEGLGLCLRYNRQSELSTFIQDVLDHIGGSVQPNRSTGRLALTLLRGDYDLDAIPLFTYESGLLKLEQVETASQEDVVNECIVKWTDPIGKEERSARVQNLASMQAMGAPNSTTTSYAGIPTVELALRVAQRDLKVSANSLKRYTVVLDRRAWRIVPGSVFRVSVPERGIYNAVLRAGKVTEAGGSDGRITVQAVLDVFGLPTASFVAPQESDWVPPSRTAMIADKRLVREATYAELSVALDAANLAILSPDVGAISTVAAKPSPLSQAYDVSSIATGDTDPTVGRGSFAPYVTVPDAITTHQTDIPFSAVFDAGLIRVGAALQINGEIGKLGSITIDDLTGEGTMTIARGCVDTIPMPHPAGTTIFIISDEVGGDGREYASGETVDVKILPFTSTSKLNLDLAPADEVNIVGRQGRPYAPGNMRANGTRFDNNPVAVGDIALTWAHRDRIIQQDQLIAHAAASIGPEPGTTYTVRVYDGDTLSPVRTVTGITAAEFTYTSVMASADDVGNDVWFEVEAVRDGYVSFSVYRFNVEYEAAGYGEGYGDAYGE